MGRQGHVSKEPLELNRVIARCLNADALRLSRESVQVCLELCTEPLFIVASESHLGRAVTNLVRNALEAIDQHGRVVVRTESAVLSEATAGYETINPGSYAVVSVHDSGRGIAPHDISRLFEPFFSSKRLNDHSGSGLGLSIVHGVVKEHGGFVNVQSSVDCGTTFTLYLPRAAEVRTHSMMLSHAPRGCAKCWPTRPGRPWRWPNSKGPEVKKPSVGQDAGRPDTGRQEARSLAPVALRARRPVLRRVPHAGQAAGGQSRRATCGAITSSPRRPNRPRPNAPASG